MATSSAFSLPCHPQLSRGFPMLFILLLMCVLPNRDAEVWKCAHPHVCTQAHTCNVEGCHICTAPGVSARLLYHFRNPQSLSHQGSRQLWTPLECYMWVFVCHSLTIAACLHAVCVYFFFDIAYRGLQSS